ncbi:hypothetical protein DM826_07315 [Halonotius aquaticus]|uniref:Uncharacterized protein n=2 Tax=Halonotius aquaticus TaxID=2216978 RepID=A0A3A6PNH8_9EURY|nr:hypothetical protein DM826_07315 [Halonotius aquaticus]
MYEETTMATSFTSRQAALDRFESVDSQTRNQFIEHFDNDGTLSSRDRVPGCAVNEAHTAMWVPEDADLPIIMSVEEYAERPVGDWWRGIEEADGDEIDVFVLTLDDVAHVLKAELVERLADAGDTTIKPILSQARMHNSKNEAPVVFEMDDGRVLLAPRATDPNDITEEEN